MAKHLTDRDVGLVVQVLDGWHGTLTWELLSRACRPVVGMAPARQTLYRFTRIRQAFVITKERLKNGPSEVKTRISMRVAIERINRLTVENERLAQENSRLLQQFVVWQYNAHTRGLTQNDLSRALPGIDRGNID